MLLFLYVLWDNCVEFWIVGSKLALLQSVKKINHYWGCGLTYSRLSYPLLSSDPQSSYRSRFYF